MKEQWQKACDLYASRYYWRKAQWADVRALFTGIGRDFIPMKGAAFGFRIYPKPFRDMSDFDVLIRESELLAVHACLGKSGVSPVISRPASPGTTIFISGIWSAEAFSTL